MTANAHPAGADDDPTIDLYLDDAHDTLWALEFIAEWLDHASADTHDDLNDFCQSCGRHQSIENVQTTIIGQARTIRRRLAAHHHQGAAID